MKFALLAIALISCLLWIATAPPPRQPAEPKAAAAKAAPTPEEQAAAERRASERAAENARLQRDIESVLRLKGSMKNPASFQLEQALRMDDGTLCLSYRATNSFNAIVPGQAVISAGKIVTSDTRPEFVRRWNSRCADKSGVVVTYLRQFL